MPNFYPGQTDYITKLNELALANDVANVAADAAAATFAAALAVPAAATATTQAGIATSAAGIATSAEATATIQAGIATSKANEATVAVASASAIVLGVASGYPSVHPVLNLDFANSQSVDPRITFTRASTATRVNSRGLIEAVASGTPRIDYDPITLACRGLLVEESRTNLLTYSQDFDDAAWTKSNSTVRANAATAPDGTLTADKITESAVTNLHAAWKTLSAATVGSVYTLSVYAKAGERTNLWISGFGEVDSYFNLLTGAVISGATASIQSVGNGWYRCSSVITKTNTSNDWYVGPANSAPTYSYTGDGTSGIYIWGAQLEAGSFPTSYVPSAITHTGRASTATYIGSNGLIQTAAAGEARYAYNPLNLSAAPALLLEESRTNLLTYSGAVGGTNWASYTTTMALNSAAAPDGTTTATLASDTSTSSSMYFDQNIAVPNDSGTYTFSMYVKANTVAQTSLVGYFVGGSTPLGTGAYCTYLWANGTYSKAFDAIDGGVIDVGNGWKRFYTVFKNNSTGNTTCFARLFVESSGVAATGSVYVWGAQVEAGSYPTSYIPTTTAQVTRAADTSTSVATTRAADAAVMTGSNFSGWFRPDEGTFACDFDVYASTSTGYDRVWEVSDSVWVPQNNLILLKQDGSGAYYTTLNSGGVAQAIHSTAAVTANTLVKTAFGYAINNVNLANNGAIGSTDTSAALPLTTQNRLAIGCDFGGFSSINGHIRSIRYYPRRLSNAQLQTITQA